MRVFKHSEETLRHPYFFFERKGRASVAEVRTVAEIASRPFIDFMMKAIDEMIRPALAEGEYIFMSHHLSTTASCRVQEHYLDFTLTHDAEGKHCSGPIAMVSLINPGVMRWTRDARGGLVYFEIADDPALFRETFEEMIRSAFGKCIVK